MPERSHLSIGEVLSLLREEFPDVTISKIRFLESQGLVDPERTPSGYRKFYDHDVERLRWILRQQREHFLPLKVIRGRLSERGEQGEHADPDDELRADSQSESNSEPVAVASRSGVARDSHPAQVDWASASSGPLGASRDKPPARLAAASEAIAGATESARPNLVGGPVEPSRGGRVAAPLPSLFAELHQRQETARRPAASQTPAALDAGDSVPVDDADTFTADELAAAAGTEAQLVADLKQFGLIAPHATVAGTPYYDESALAVTRAAADFARHGVEARHLRIWRNASDRETDLFQQVVLPLLRQRNPQARRQALDTLAELAEAGAALRSALVERAIRDIR